MYYLVKYVFPILILTSILPLSSHSQIGFKAGMTASSFQYKGQPLPMRDFEIDLRPYLGYDAQLPQLGEQKPLYSPYLSIYWNYEPIERGFIRPEVSYHQKGVSFNQNEYEDITYRVKIHYIEFPVSLGYSIINKNRSIWDIYLGGYISFNAKAIKQTGYHNSGVTATQLDNVSSMDGGFHIGTDFKYQIGNHHLVFDLRTFLGLKNVLYVPSEQVMLYESVQEVRLTGFTISIGYEI